MIKNQLLPPPPTSSRKKRKKSNNHNKELFQPPLSSTIHNDFEHEQEQHCDHINYPHDYRLRRKRSRNRNMSKSSGSRTSFAHRISSLFQSKKD